MRYASLFSRWLRTQSLSRRERKSGVKHSWRPVIDCLEDRTLPSITLSPVTLPADTINVPYDQAYTAGGAINAFYANQVVSYAPGAIPDAGYDNPAVALGGLNPVTGSYAGSNYYLTPFDPAYSSSDLVEVGAGGSLVLKLAQTASTNGDTIGVHTGFGLADADYPNGTNSDPASYFNSFVRQADVLVSADGVNWGDLGTLTFDNPSNLSTGAATDPEGGSPGVGPAANVGQPFVGSLSSFNGENWQQTLATLNGSAGGTWLNLSGVTDENGNPIAGVNYIEFSVPNNPPLDPNTGNPEIMMVDAVVGTNSTASISANGGAGDVTLAVSNIQNPIAGLTVPSSGINGLAIGGTPTATGTETFTVTATDSLNNTTTSDYSITVNPTPTLNISGAASVHEGTAYTLNLSGVDANAINDWTINWGDGSSPQIVTGNPTSVTHVYATGAHTYVVSASATDDLGAYHAAHSVNVAVKHVAPVPTISGAAEIDQGSTYTLDLSATVGHTVTRWAINWGDNSAIQFVTGDPADVTHVYRAGPSTHTIHASASDNVGTYSAVDAVTVRVDHVAPTLTISGAASVNEKAVYTLDLAATAPGGVDITRWTILWGDGAVQSVIGNPTKVTHVYAVGPNAYDIEATASDPEGTYAAVNTVSVTVNHVPPTLRLRGATSVNEAATYTLTLSAGDTHPISLWTINWGDGTVQTATGNPTTVTHIYPLGPNSYIISATATDSVGTYPTATNLTVNVKHPAPVVTFTGASSVNEGATYSLTLAGVDIHPISQWTINWGDGSPLQVASGNPTSVTHVYAAGPHTYVIHAAATDDVGTYQATNRLTVSVKHVPPVLAISGAAEVDQGSTYTLNLSASEAAGHAVTRWFINWGDGSPLQIVAGDPAAVTHVYRTGPSTHTIHAGVADDVGLYAAGNTVAVTVDHVAPTLQISGAASVNEKQAYTLHLASSAPGAITIKSWTILWGDGSVQTVTGNPASVTHVYAVGPNAYTIMASATDPEGTYAAVNTVSVTVNHVPPTLRISGAASVEHGANYTLNLFGVDTHPINQWAINWGDGSPVQTVTGNPASVTHVYAVGHSASTITATATDAEGTYAAADSVRVTVI